MGGLHDLHVGFESHHPGGEVHGSKFGLGVTRGHVDNESLDLALGDLRELIGKDLVVVALDKLRPDVMNVVQKGILDFFLFVEVLKPLLQQKDLSHGIDRYMSQFRHRSHYKFIFFFEQIIYVKRYYIYQRQGVPNNIRGGAPLKQKNLRFSTPNGKES